MGKKDIQSGDPFKALNDKIKYYLTEILTLKKIRDEQFTTITELRSENHNLKKELQRFKGK